MTIEENRGCAGCKTLEGATGDDFCLDDEGNVIYWFGTFKGNKDFVILRTDDQDIVQKNFLICTDKMAPSNEKYDWYCFSCYYKIMHELGYYLDDEAPGTDEF